MENRKKDRPTLQSIQSVFKTAFNYTGRELSNIKPLFDSKEWKILNLNLSQANLNIKRNYRLKIVYDENPVYVQVLSIFDIINNTEDRQSDSPSLLFQRPGLKHIKYLELGNLCKSQMLHMSQCPEEIVMSDDFCIAFLFRKHIPLRIRFKWGCDFDISKTIVNNSIIALYRLFELAHLLEIDHEVSCCYYVFRWTVEARFRVYVSSCNPFQIRKFPVQLYEDHCKLPIN